MILSDSTRGVIVQIYRCEMSDSSNDGVTSPKNAKGKIFIIFDSQIQGGNYALAEEIDNPNVVCLQLVRRPIANDGGNYFHAEPIERRHGAPCFGGNFVFTSDSRLRKICEYPIPVHDRFE